MTPIQCDENPKGLDGVIIYDGETFTMNQHLTPVQCVENPDGLDGVLLYDGETFAMNKQHVVDPRRAGTNSTQFNFKLPQNRHFVVPLHHIDN